MIKTMTKSNLELQSTEGSPGQKLKACLMSTESVRRLTWARDVGRSRVLS